MKISIFSTSQQDMNRQDVGKESKCSNNCNTDAFLIFWHRFYTNALGSTGFFDGWNQSRGLGKLGLCWMLDEKRTIPEKGYTL